MHPNEGFPRSRKDDDKPGASFDIVFTFRNVIPINLFTGRARRYALQCPIAAEFIVLFLGFMQGSRREIEKGVGRYVPAVTGRLRRSVYVYQFLLSGVPLMTSRVVYAGVEFGAYSRRSRDRRRQRGFGRADDLADAMKRYVASSDFGNIVERAARRAANHCNQVPGVPG